MVVMLKKTPCSVTLLTRNSSATLRQCLESVSFCDDIVVLDGNSTDTTVSIAEEFGARVYPQYDNAPPGVRIKNFTELRVKSFNLAQHAWVFYIDSDEYLQRELQEEIMRIVAHNDVNTVGMFCRRAIVEGKEIRHAYFYPDWCARLINKESGVKWKEGPLVHEGFVFPQSMTRAHLRGSLFAYWPDYQATAQKDAYYLSLSETKFERDIEKVRWRDFARGAVKNSLRAMYIFLKAMHQSIRFHNDNVLPFRFQLRFATYHLKMAWSYTKWKRLAARTWRATPRMLKFILIGALLVRLLAFAGLLWTHGHTGFVYGPNGDAVEYVTLAKNIMQDNGFSIAQHAPFVPNDFRTPGYPFFLMLFGGGNDIFWLPVLVQIVLSTVLVCMVWRLVRERISIRAASVAAAFAAFEPNMIYWPLQLISETVFTVLLFGCVWLLVKFVECRQPRILLGGIALLMIATYVRPVTLPLVYIAPFVFFVVLKKQFRRARHYASLAILLVVFSLAPWYIRNGHVFGAYSFSPSFAARGSVGKYLTAYTRLRFGKDPAQLYPEIVAMSQSPLVPAQHIIARTRETLLRDPLAYMQIGLTALPSFFVGYVEFSLSATLDRSFEMPRSWYVGAKMLYALLTVGAIVGGILLWQKNKVLVCVCTGAIMYFAILSGVGGYARFRYPVEPYLWTLLSGVAFRPRTNVVTTD